MIDGLETDLKADEYKLTLKRLRKMSEGLQGDVVTFGLARAADNLKKIMQAGAPQGVTGNVKAAIGRSKLSKSAAKRLSVGPGEVSMIVGPNRKVAGANWGWLANILEHGAASHEIKPRKKKAINAKTQTARKRKGGAAGQSQKRLRMPSGSFNVGQQFRFVTKVNHPGINAKNFMSNAKKQADSQFEAIFFDGMKTKLDKIAAAK